MMVCYKGLHNISPSESGIDWILSNGSNKPAYKEYEVTIKYSDNYTVQYMYGVAVYMNGVSLKNKAVKDTSVSYDVYNISLNAGDVVTVYIADNTINDEVQGETREQTAVCYYSFSSKTKVSTTTTKTIASVNLTRIDSIIIDT